MSYDSIFRPGLFDGQTIIVTGGGRATASARASRQS
ncbi:2,4-dienoyl-CoA reductase, partial [Pseudomonas aeruginosa]